jgi:hypothetical protein
MNTEQREYIVEQLLKTGWHTREDLIERWDYLNSVYAALGL